MKQLATPRRRLVSWFATALCLFAACHACAQVSINPSADRLRRNLAYAEAMRPAGLASLRGSYAATRERLGRVPELQRAEDLATLDQDGTLPYHLQASFQLSGDFGRQRTGTVEADRYNDRWSRLVVTLDGVRSSQWVLDGRTVTDDRMPAIPFSLQRLLRALFSPLDDAVAAKVPIAADTVPLQGTLLHCTVLGRQPALETGMVPSSRSVCVDPVTGDVRLDVGGYGFRTEMDDIQAMGQRRVAGHVQVLQNDTVVADLRLHLHVAGDLTPASFAEDLQQARAAPASGPRFCFMARPSQMHADLETLDVHVIPLDDESIGRHPALVAARMLVGTDGRVADMEVLGDADPQLRAKALTVLRGALFRRREWKGDPVCVEGLLLLRTP